MLDKIIYSETMEFDDDIVIPQYIVPWSFSSEAMVPFQSKLQELFQRYDEQLNYIPTKKNKVSGNLYVFQYKSNFSF